jgi:hypothetical protein
MRLFVKFAQFGILEEFVYSIRNGQCKAPTAIEEATPQYIVMKKRQLCPDNGGTDRCSLSLPECLFGANCGVLINFNDYLTETAFRIMLYGAIERLHETFDFDGFMDFCRCHASLSLSKKPHNAVWPPACMPDPPALKKVFAWKAESRGGYRWI